MKLRTRVLMAQAPLVVALVTLALVATMGVGELGRRADRILRENYRSVLAAQRIKESAERIDSGTLFLAAGHDREANAAFESHLSHLEAEVVAQELNLTEPGELEATAALRRAWESYRSEVERYRGVPAGSGRIDVYFARVGPAFHLLREKADRVLSLNQDAMVRKSDEAADESRRLSRLLVATSAVACAVGALLSAWLTARVLRPLRVVQQTARRIGEGDLAARARVGGGDEISALAGEINTMAGRLEAYRASTAGELLDARNSLQAALDGLPDPTLILGPAGDVRGANEAALRLLPTDARRSGATSIEGLDPMVREAVLRAHAHVLRTGGEWAPSGLDQAIRVDGADGPGSYLAHATPVRAVAGGVTASAIVLRDVTRLVRAGEMKDDLVATVAHEFRTPLTSLRMAIHLCLEDVAGPTTPKQRELLVASRFDCERLQRLVDEMLDIAKLRSGAVRLNLAATDAGAVVRAVAAAAATSAREAGVRVTCEASPTAAAVSADADRVRLALGNLVENAIRHSPRGGRVEILALSAPATVRFEVLDRGPGVPAAARDSIFERGSRGARGGAAGLGLWIAREIVRAHGGEIGVDARDGGGSSFWFTIPAAAGG